MTLSFGGLFAPERLRDQIKDRFILKGLTNLNYQAIGLQNLDLVHGVNFLVQSPTPLVAFYYTESQVEPFMLIDAGKHQLFLRNGWVTGLRI